LNRISCDGRTCKAYSGSDQQGKTEKRKIEKKEARLFFLLQQRCKKHLNCFSSMGAFFFQLPLLLLEYANAQDLVIVSIRMLSIAINFSARPARAPFLLLLRASCCKLRWEATYCLRHA
jgi:hypothetical protein